MGTVLKYSKFVVNHRDSPGNPCHPPLPPNFFFTVPRTTCKTHSLGSDVQWTRRSTRSAVFVYSYASRKDQLDKFSRLPHPTRLLQPSMCGNRWRCTYLRTRRGGRCRHGRGALATRVHQYLVSGVCCTVIRCKRVHLLNTIFIVDW